MIKVKLEHYTVKVEVMVILFFSYIYDAVRDGYIEKVRARFKAYREQEAELRAGFLNDSNEEGSRERNQSVSGPPIDKIAKKTDGYILSLLKIIKEIFKRTLMILFNPDYKDYIRSDQSIEDEKYIYCPLDEMPKYLRIYQCISTTYMVYAFMKYGIVCFILYTKFFKKDRSYACYFPGRLDFISTFQYELPSFIFIMVSYHVVFRILWYIVTPRMNLDCFIFIVWPAADVRKKAQQLYKLNDEEDNSYLFYIENILFYQRIDLGNGKLRYTLRESRSIEHLMKLRHFVRMIMIFWVSAFLILGIPSTMVVISNMFSMQYFSDMYHMCKRFTNRDPNDPNFRWQTTDPYRLIALAFDGLDNLMMAIDTCNAMVWPFTSSIICTTDICFRLQTLNVRLSDIKTRMVLMQTFFKSKRPRQARCRSHRQRERESYEKSMETELRCVQKEITEIYEQINQVDIFTRQFSAFCIYVWVTMNFSYQSFSFYNRRFMYINSVVLFFQILGFVLLTFTFILLTRAYSLNLTLHRHLCSIIALDQNTSTKLNWIWYLQYYDPFEPRFTLHIGHDSYCLSMATYLRSMLWFFSLGLLTINLLRLQLDELVSF